LADLGKRMWEENSQKDSKCMWCGGVWIDFICIGIQTDGELL